MRSAAIEHHAGPPVLKDRGTAQRPHETCASWPEHEGEPAHAVFWATSDGRIVLKALLANGRTRGRAMLRWILSTYRRPIHVVEVLPVSTGFWRRMVDEGLVSAWSPSDGHASPLHRLAVPLPSPRRIAA